MNSFCLNEHVKRMTVTPTISVWGINSGLGGSAYKTKKQKKTIK